MTIGKTLNNGNLTITPEGRLDSLNSGDLEALLEQELNDDIALLTFDLDKVDFVSSKGLRVLVSAYKKMAGKDTVITNANSSVKEVLRLSGLLKVFKISE